MQGCVTRSQQNFQTAGCSIPGGQPAETRLAARKDHSADKVAAFKAWAEQQLTRIPGKSDLAKAFRYALSRWPSFTLFLGDGRVAIDNNAAERAMRPIGVGRKNWLFAGSDTGGETLARARTLIESAKMSGLDPQAYLADVLDRINDHKINRLHELLPWNWATIQESTRETEAARVCKAVQSGRLRSEQIVPCKAQIDEGPYDHPGWNSQASERP